MLRLLPLIIIVLLETLWTVAIIIGRFTCHHKGLLILIAYIHPLSSLNKLILQERSRSNTIDVQPFYQRLTSFTPVGVYNYLRDSNFSCDKLS
jgi:hypothetical protein